MSASDGSGNGGPGTVPVVILGPTSLPLRETNFFVLGKLLTSMWKCNSRLYKLLPWELSCKRMVVFSVNLRHSSQSRKYKTLNSCCYTDFTGYVVYTTKHLPNFRVSLIWLFWVKFSSVLPRFSSVTELLLEIQENRWLVGNLFYDAFSVARLYGVDDKAISEWWWIGKDLVGSGRGLILRYYPCIRLEWLRKTRTTSIRIAGSRGREFEPGISRIRSRSWLNKSVLYHFLISYIAVSFY
jgi:hypothetical protein